MSAESETPKPAEGETSGSNKKKEEEEARFECNICLDIAKDAVVSMCGHLFCWSCLSQWFDTRPNNQVCPVCKSAIDSNKVVPIYGRGGNTTDPRKKVPPRPRGQRTEAQSSAFPGFQWGGVDGLGGGNVQFSFGIGIFPLSFMASWFNTNAAGDERRAEQAAPGSRQYQEEEFLNNIFKYFGVVMLLWLFFV